MATPPLEVNLALTPRSRLDVINVSSLLERHSPGFFSRFRRTLYCSFHTTAGYLEQTLCSRLRHKPESVQEYVRAFQTLFPPEAGYRHDELHLRTELTEEQRVCEPRNGDSHLTYIGSGLRNCVSYVNRADTPGYFIDLDGMNGAASRTRSTTVIGYDREEIVEKRRLWVPVSEHPVDSVSIRDPKLGLLEELTERIARYDITKGKIELSLAPSERNAGLTVNEYETLLMKHDLHEVLRNPLRFMAEKGRNMLIDPRTVPQKTINYAKYDLVLLVNNILDSMGATNSPLERIVDKFLAVPAARFLRMKRKVNLLVSDRDIQGRGRIVQGTYQSPILVQWDRAAAGHRVLDVTISRFR
jgi:thiamine phosphate synthase YjbQ (UPF0047 family)